MMFKRPPPKDKLIDRPYTYVGQYYPEKADDYRMFYDAMDAKGQYLHYDEFRRRVPQELDTDLAWALTKLARSGPKQTIIELGSPMVFGTFMPTPVIQKTTTIVDQNTTTAALEWTIKKIGEEQHLKYLLNDLIEDEAISSSQLEGAATTTLIAKDMLKRKREPRSMDEKMILGNFKLMRLAWDMRDERLTPELIKKFHAVGVSGIDDENYTPGVYRGINDDVVITDGDNIVYTPPPASSMDWNIRRLCNWVNEDHDELESINYIHPLIKAITIHFAIGYEHPFRDGNGRVARALYYWFLFKKNYGAFRYISISNLLKDSAKRYGKSYLYTETDDMDLTYFIDYQCSVILRAVSEFKKHCQKIIKDIEDFNKWLWQSGVYRKLSDKQKAVFQVAKSGIAKSFTTTNVKENLGCSYNTAATVLNGLVELNLFDKQKDGKEWIYSLRDKQEIQKNWIS